ncbi:MAG TPA: hypothetical protein VFV16_08445, partial [Candidatus Nitrosotalea sp.]|nr:hypothetical protein [Candidatus Nitrosotalea sp.]
MKVKSSRTFVGVVISILFFSMISTMPNFASGTTADLSTRLEGNATGIYYPLYSLSELPQVL